jgi:nitrite reductase (NO-forming)
LDDREGWALRNVVPIRSALRKLFGLVWGVDAALKFLPGTPFWFSERVLAASIGQPAWLDGWFAFWVQQASTNSVSDVYAVAGLEFAVSFALIAGFLRKTAYFGGIALSLLIWAVPEGFGGPYNPGTFDIGVGVVYAMAFLFLLALEADRDANRGTLDSWLGRRFSGWSRWAEVAEQAAVSAEGQQAEA